jgi:Spy/CpxP family protein refolding chaperone
MKKLVIICALLISAVSFTKAQGQGGTPEEMAQRTLDVRLVSLNLTADQKAKLTPMLVAYNKTNVEAMTKARAAADPQAAMTELRTKMAPMAAENEKAALALLTADQKKAYDAALAAAKERNPNATAVFFGGGGGRGGQGGGGGQR